MTQAPAIMTDDEVTSLLSEFKSDDLRIDADRLAKSFSAYVRAAWPIIESSQAFQPNWHIEEMCRILQEAYGGNPLYRRIVFNVPPGTLKSLLLNVFFPTWVWTRNAKKRFLTASYGAHLTTRDNLRSRQLIESPWYQERWPVHLLDDQNTKTRYNTTEHGWRVATSVGGVGTGEHPDFIFIDDPTSAAQAASDTERATANEWFDGTVSTRLGRNPVIIVIMQRLHEDDLSGHLIKRGGWTHFRWPMRYEQCTCPTGVCDLDEAKRCAYHKADPLWMKDTSDPRTQSGELLFPSFFPESKVRQLELDLGPFGAAGQLQQRPAPEGGGLFKREWFKFVDVAPALARRIRGWDTAGTEGGGDWTVGAKVSEEWEWVVADGRRTFKSTGRFFVEDVQRDQLGPDGVDKLMKATAELDGKAVGVREEKEGGSAGKAVVEIRAKNFKGYDYKCVVISGSKIVRAKPFRAQCEAGNVSLVRAPWNEPYLRVLCSFPTASHDDDVDASSCAFNQVLLEEPPRQHDITW